LKLFPAGRIVYSTCLQTAETGQSEFGSVPWIAVAMFGSANWGIPMRSFVAYALCAVSVLIAPNDPARAAGSLLDTQKPWNLDYGATQCTAMRTYDHGEQPVTLAIIPGPSGDNYELVVTYKRKAPVLADEYEGAVDFGSRPISTWALKYGEGDLTMYQFRLSSAEMAEARSAHAINLRLNGALNVGFTLTQMSPLMDALQKCTADLQDFWNMGGERNGRIAVPSKGDVRTVFKASDYPQMASRRWQDGAARFLLLIDEHGAVAGCHVLTPSGVPALDAMGCLVIQARSKMTPATDATGKPVRSTMMTPAVVWRLVP
jgi:Gram-negative bacterial TonB protein C-terminal